MKQGQSPPAMKPTSNPKEPHEEDQQPQTLETLHLHTQEQTLETPHRHPQEETLETHHHHLLTMHHNQHHPTQSSSFKLKNTTPHLGDSGKLTSTFDLVDQSFFLYVRLVKARDLSATEPYAEIKLGNYKGTTKTLDKKQNPEWNQVFAFSRDRIQSSTLEIFIKEREMMGRDEYLGKVTFDLNEAPIRVSPDSPLAPQWYRLEDYRREGKLRGEVMAAVWVGTQADESYSDAWHADGAAFSGAAANLRSKVYVSPKLWYLRVNVIEAQDLQLVDRRRVNPDLSVKAQVGPQVLKTRHSKNPTPLWNEDLVFVAAEPFEETLTLTVEDHVSPGKDQVLGKLSLPLYTFERRLDHRPVESRWFDLEKFNFGALEGDRHRRELTFASRIHLRVCLEGAYHVLDEPTMYLSDQRPTSRQLWKKPVGVLELGFLGAKNLTPMKARQGKSTTDAYCVAKYGQKWVRTRTAVDSLNPRWNEQYNWEVYDPCTVLTLAVFDNSGTGKDTRIGKIRIRLSGLETDKVYHHGYSLLVLSASGLKKMGEIEIAMRFTCLSMMSMMHLYGKPLLPKMHYVHPFTVNQLDSLRNSAMAIVASRLGRAEPPLKKEVVEYLLDSDSHAWSMRKSKANFFRIMGLLSGIVIMMGWMKEVREWKNPLTSVLVNALFVILVFYPELVVPTTFLYMFLIGVWNYRLRERTPPEMDARLSWAEAVSQDEIDEEFDTFPTSQPLDVVRMRYDRLRTVAGRIQTVAGDMAAQGERLQAVLSWRDPRATGLFLVFCLGAALVMYVLPGRVVALGLGFYGLRHPRFRSKLPSVPSNFFRRLPSKMDSLL